MLRSKEIVLVCHCVLNQNSVVYPLARAKGPFKFTRELIGEEVGIIQLPCPELKHLGITRGPMDKKGYDTPEYRSLCQSLSQEIVNEISVYIDDGYEVKGIVAINESPSCSISGETGVFMEELLKVMEDKQIKLNYIEVPADYNDDTDSDSFYTRLRENLKFQAR